MRNMNPNQGVPSRDELKQRLKRRYAWLKDFDDNEIQEISFCYESGHPMREGEQYLDLATPERGVIHAKAGEKVQDGHCLISKSQLKDETWQKLIQPFKK